MARLVFSLVVIAIAGAAHLVGLFNPLTYRLIDEQFRMLPRPATGTILVVEIDPVSLRNIGVWPWPRSLHGRVLDQLAAAGAGQVVLDIDFAATSDPAEDMALAEALARSSVPITMPVFRQYSDIGNGAAAVVESAPLPLFRQFVALASANVSPESDGLVRRLAANQDWGDRQWPTLAGVLAEVPDDDTGSFYIDFGIAPDSVERLSYFDVLVGNFDPSLVAGRRVIVAATALELGDVAAVPGLSSLPGGYVQVLAAESLLQGRTLSLTPPWIVLLIIAGIALAAVRVFDRLSWPMGLAIILGTTVALLLSSIAAYTLMGHLLDVMPWAAAIVLAYVAALTLRIDELAVGLLVQTIDLRRKNAFMSRVAEHAFDGLVTTDAQGRIVTFSRSAQRIFGYAAAEAEGMRLDRICRLPGPESTLTRATTPSDASPLAVMADRAPFETVGHGAGGVSIPIDVAVTALPDDDGASFIFVIRDISKRKAAEAREAQARTRLVDAVECSPGGFALFDAENRLVLGNAQYRDFLSAAGDAMVPGADLRNIVLAHAAAEGLSADRSQQSLKFWTGDGEGEDLQLPDGRWLSAGHRKTTDGGTVVVATDITVAREREREISQARQAAEHASAAKSEFLAMISHELRTPLNAVIGFSEMMAQKVFGDLGSPHYEEYVDDIKTSGEHLLSLINSIIDLNKIDSGSMELNEQEFAFEPILKKCLVLQKPVIERKSLQLSVDLGPDQPLLMVDQALLSKAISNVVSNAVKFTPESGRITVAVARGGDGEFDLQVSDTGIGMDAAGLSKAMEPFQQIDSALSREYEGIGLGLPLAKAAVELHGGTLLLDSEPGIGTTVTIRLPGSRLLASAPMAAA